MVKKMNTKKIKETTFDPYILCPDWDKLSWKYKKVVFRWFADRGSCRKLK